MSRPHRPGGIGWVGLQGGCLGQRLFFQIEIGVQIDIGGLDGLVAEPKRDNGTVDAVLQQVHRRGVTRHVRRHTFLLQRGACCLCHRQMRAVHALRSQPVRLPPTVALGRCSPIRRLRRGLPRQGLARGADLALAPEHLPLGFALRHSQLRFQPRATLAGLRRRLRPAPASRPLPRSAAMAANPAQPTIARRVWFQAEPVARPLRPVPLPLRPARSCARAHTASQRQEPAARRLAAACSAPPAYAARPLRQDPADPLETLTRSGWPPSPRLTLPAPADSAFLDRACKLFVNAYSPRFHSCQWDVGSR